MALNAHFLIVKTAKEIANGLFEVYARDNATYRTLRARGDVPDCPLPPRLSIWEKRIILWRCIVAQWDVALEPPLTFRLILARKFW